MAKRDPASDPATVEEITYLVGEVEAVKQLNPPLSGGQRTILIYELSKLGYTVRKLREMAEGVKRRTTYGNIALEHWLAGSVVTDEDLVEERKAIQREDARRWKRFEEAVEQKLIERIESAMESLSPQAQERDKRGMEYLALIDRMRAYEIARRGWYEAADARAKKRLVECKQKLRGMDRPSRIVLLDLAVRSGQMVTYDDSIIDNIHLFPDKLLSCVEEMAKVVASNQQEES